MNDTDYKNIKPLYDRVLVEVETTPKETKNGIMFPESAKKKKSRGIVKAIGEGRLNNDGSIHPLQVKVGDKVLFGKWAGTDVNDEEDDKDGWKIIKEDDILATIQ